ncbi:MAG: hypothetical protein H6676_06425 [Thermoflexaceae bacterium]|nr:hypothetical protein [Thermoflexaceae bacterium]
MLALPTGSRWTRCAICSPPRGSETCAPICRAATWVSTSMARPRMQPKRWSAPWPGWGSNGSRRWSAHEQTWSGCWRSTRMESSRKARNGT